MKFKKQNTKSGAVMFHKLVKPNTLSFIGAYIITVSEHKISVECWSNLSDDSFEKTYVKLNELPDLKGGEETFNSLLIKSNNLLNFLK